MFSRRFYGTPNWQAYGYIEVRLFPLFGFFAGIKIVDEQFDAPSKVSTSRLQRKFHFVPGRLQL